MRIAYVCSDPGIALDGHKGAAVHVREMARAMAMLGHEVRIFVARAGDPPSIAGVSAVEVLPDAADVELSGLVAADPSADGPLTATLRSMLAASSFRHRTRAALLAWRPDLIYERYALFGTAGRIIAAELSVPHVLEVNAPLADEQARHRGLALVDTVRELEQSITTRADLVVAVSGALREWLIGLGADARRIITLPNAVDPERFYPDPGAARRMRARLGMGDSPVIGFLGSLRPWHDVDALLVAVARVVSGGSDARLMVVGDGPRRQELERAAEELGLAARCTFTGAVPHEQVPSLLAAMDLTVAPYAAADGFYFSPLKIVESLAAGVPVLAAAAGDIACCVVPGRTGWTYVPGDGDSLATALETACLANERAAMGARGRQHVLASHTWRDNAGRVLGAALRGTGATRHDAVLEAVQ